MSIQGFSNQSSWCSCRVSTCHDRDRLSPLSERSPALSKGIPHGDDASSCLSLLGCQSTLARFTPSDSLQRHCHCALRPRCIFGHNRLADDSQTNLLLKLILKNRRRNPRPGQNAPHGMSSPCERQKGVSGVHKISPKEARKIISKITINWPSQVSWLQGLHWTRADLSYCLYDAAHHSYVTSNLHDQSNCECTTGCESSDIQFALSGSPIISNQGEAIGVIFI